MPKPSEPSFVEQYIYDLDKEVLDSLRLMYFDSLTFEQKTEQEYLDRKKSLNANYTRLAKPVEAPMIVVSKPRPEKKEILSDFDRYNKRRLSNQLQPLTEEEFDAQMDQLSISGEESTEEEVLDTIEEDKPKAVASNEAEPEESSISFLNTQSASVLFESELLDGKRCYSAYKTILDANSYDSEPMKTLLALNNAETKKDLEDHVSALFMIGGGHFAGAIISHKPIVVRGNKGSNEELQLQAVHIVEQKTFHRYTTRRKQGGSQSASDNAKGKANSAGSTLRRYNEQALRDEVRELLKAWKPQLDKCQSIYVKANGVFAHQSLISKDPEAALHAGDKRIKNFPFATKRPTTMELRRAWCELAYLKVVSKPKARAEEVEKEKKRVEMLAKSRQVKQSSKAEPKQSSVEDEVVGLLKKGKVSALMTYVRKNKVNVNMAVGSGSLLHHAAKQGYARMCQTLLVNLKADPTVLNDFGKTAYEVASDQQTRYAFEIARFNLGEDYCDWEKGAKVPYSRSRDEVENLKKKEQEDESKQLREIHERELKNARKGLKVDHDRKFGKGRTLGSTEQDKVNQLTPQQRMRVMREQMARAAERRMQKQ